MAPNLAIAPQLLAEAHEIETLPPSHSTARLHRCFATAISRPPLRVGTSIAGRGFAAVKAGSGVRRRQRFDSACSPSTSKSLW